MSCDWPPAAAGGSWTLEQLATPEGSAAPMGMNEDGDVLFGYGGVFVWPSSGPPVEVLPAGAVGGLATGLSDRDASGVVQFAAVAVTRGVSGNHFLYQIGADPSTTVSQAIGSIGGNWSDPSAINALGHVVGEGLVATKRTTQVAHAFLQTGNASTIKDIGTLGGEDSWATAINRFGDIIGMGETAKNTGLGDQYDSRFIRTGGVMYDLEKMIDGPLPAELRNISGISDSRIICGPSFILVPYTP